jgi:hypothetical protein
LIVHVIRIIHSHYKYCDYFTFLFVGDNVIVGSKDGKLCWFDTDLSTRPYKTMKYDSFFIYIPFEYYKKT